MTKNLKEKILTNEKALGGFVNAYNPSLVEMLGFNGYDFVVIDNEHGAFSQSEITEMIRAAKRTNMSPIVRTSYDPSSIQKALDNGAEGVQVPMINNQEQAEEVVSKAKYPPVGMRGVAYSIPAAQYGTLSGRSYLDQANKNSLISVHIETKEAVQNFEEIIVVNEIDIAFIGSTDLAVNLGYDNPGHPEVQSVISNLFKKAKQHDIKMGLVASDSASAAKAFEQGASYVAVVINKVIMEALNEVVSNSKNGINE
ncbi:HpcH/HpaI aldolase/citrate lyase family protein [Oceanobacillus sp. CFH 90083]|uniref:HpcH/HpaI aldolase family protein n=1 Tax=Oceanobacillus sp. CFH 90083 TaxID=2592336 RepID=UPI00128E4115|nr:aldolase/citrate lyase family protein [Oceanobacillus sp. CFH 90083]